MIFKTPRIENPKHLKFIRELTCVGCRTTDRSQATHIRAGNLEWGKRATGMQEKPSDCWTIPQCQTCHDMQHRNEVGYWEALGIDPWKLAAALYLNSGNHQMAQTVIERQCWEPKQ